MNDPVLAVESKRERIGRRERVLAVESKRERIGRRESVVAKDVLAGFQVKPEIGIVQRLRREKKDEGEDVDLEDSFERNIHYDLTNTTEISSSNTFDHCPLASSSRLKADLGSMMTTRTP